MWSCPYFLWPLDLLYKALILQGEIWCWSLLGLKLKDITASCFVPKSRYISTIFSSIIESIQNIVSLDPEPFRLLPGVFFQVYFHNFKWVQRLLYRPYFMVRRYYCLYVTVSRQTQLTLGNTLSIFGPFFFFNGCVTFPSCWAGRITGIEEKPGKIKQKEKYVAQTIFNLGKLNVIIFQVKSLSYTLNGFLWNDSLSP